jgi:hypothetical protein
MGGWNVGILTLRLHLPVCITWNNFWCKLQADRLRVTKMECWNDGKLEEWKFIFKCRDITCCVPTFKNEPCIPDPQVSEAKPLNFFFPTALVVSNETN